MKKALARTAFTAALVWVVGCSDSAAKKNGTDDGFDDGNGMSQSGDTEGDHSGNTQGDTSGVQFPGGGDSGIADPLVPGVGPETADACGPGTPADATSVTVIEQELECFYSEDDVQTPAAAIEQIVEVVNEAKWVHLRLTLDPRFVDNSFGDTAIGWEGRKKGHTFKDLVGSDHAEIMMYDADGALVLQFKLDYISEDPNSASGYGTLGVTGGEGKMIVGDEAVILGAATSLDRNLNGCGLGTYTENSPATDVSYGPPSGAEAWDFRVVYEVWVDATVFGAAGFGHAEIENVHASPSKGAENTVVVIPDECPPCDPNEDGCTPWDHPCDPATEDCGEPRDTPDTDDIGSEGGDSEDTDSDGNDTGPIV